jgi:selenium metabolism protein YedF
MSQIIDARGKACPIPVVMAKQAITQGEGIFTVQVDNPTAVENLRRLADNQGYAAQVRGGEGDYAVDFRRSGAPAAEAPAAPQSPAAGAWTLLVARDTVGDGARELGSNLMQMFFYTLTQSDNPPQTVIFVNAGVKLPTLDPQIPEHLRALQAAGCRLLVCGTCLNYYQLTDQLSIGMVSNMYDIVSALEEAGKVISL